MPDSLRRHELCTPGFPVSWGEILLSGGREDNQAKVSYDNIEKKAVDRKEVTM